MFRKLAATTAATLLLASSVTQAAAATATPVRASTDSRHDNELVASPLFIIIGIVAVVGVLEITGAINIFDDEPESP